MIQKNQKHDFNNGPLVIFSSISNFYFEVDISNYKVGDNIIFIKSESIRLEIGYQFKSVFKENNLKFNIYFF